MKGDPNIWQNRLQTKTDQRQRHFGLMKGTVNQEDTTILNIYASNSVAPNFIFKRTGESTAGFNNSTWAH